MALAHQAALQPFQALAQALVDNPSGSLAGSGGEAVFILRLLVLPPPPPPPPAATAAADATAGCPSFRTTSS